MATSYWERGSANGASFEIKGLEELTAALDALPKETLMTAVAYGMHALCDVFVVALAGKVPVQMPAETGRGRGNRLGGDLQPGALLAAMRRSVKVDPGSGSGLASVNFGNLGYVADMVEYGHRMIAHDGKKVLMGPKTPDGMVRAYPFVRPAFDAAKDAAIQAFMAKAQEVIAAQWSSVGYGSKGELRALMNFDEPLTGGFSPSVGGAGMRVA